MAFKKKAEKAIETKAMPIAEVEVSVKERIKGLLNGARNVGDAGDRKRYIDEAEALLEQL